PLAPEPTGAGRISGRRLRSCSGLVRRSTKPDADASVLPAAGRQRHVVSPAPPVEPMLARLLRTLPDGDYWFEPKWDGFRCLAFRDGDAVDLRSRNQRPFARYFPEVVDGLRRLPMSRFVLDGELLA